MHESYEIQIEFKFEMGLISVLKSICEEVAGHDVKTWELSENFERIKMFFLTENKTEANYIANVLRFSERIRLMGRTDVNFTGEPIKFEHQPYKFPSLSKVVAVRNIVMLDEDEEPISIKEGAKGTVLRYNGPYRHIVFFNELRKEVSVHVLDLIGEKETIVNVVEIE